MIRSSLTSGGLFTELYGVARPCGDHDENELEHIGRILIRPANFNNANPNIKLRHGPLPRPEYTNSGSDQAGTRDHAGHWPENGVRGDDNENKF